MRPSNFATRATRAHHAHHATRRTLATATSLLCLALLLSACGESVTTVELPPGTVPGLPFPDTADKLMANFQTAYEARDLDEFERLLHPDHVTILQSSTVAQFPDVGPTLDVIEEQRIHERMFSGLDVTDPNGMLVPAVQGITFQTFARQGNWGTSPGTDPIPDTQVALYDVVVLWDRGGLYSTLKVQGSMKFYVVHQDSLVNGVTKPYYRLRGQVDLTNGDKGGGKRQGEETNPWGAVKALFR